jgi:hypothetical protein
MSFPAIHEGQQRFKSELLVRHSIEFRVASELDSALEFQARDELHRGLRGGTMKAATVVGILLLVLGVVGLAIGGISFTQSKKDVDLGPVQVSHTEKSIVPISPILSALSLIAGVGLVVVGVRNK